MAVTPYEVVGSGTPASSASPRQWVLRFGQFGGKLALLIMAVGFLVIGLGWNGAAGKPNFIAQMPYLLSGGFFGLGIVTLGASLLIVQSRRADRIRLEAKLDEVIDAMNRSTTAAPASVGQPTTDSGERVVAGASSYHRSTCRLAQGRDDSDRLSVADARARGLSACRVCKPS